MIGGILMALSVGPVRLAARTLNARVGEQVGIGAGTLCNYIGGLLAAVFVLAVVGGAGGSSVRDLLALPWWMLSGGAVGVLFVLLSNSAVPRLSALEMTLLTLLGQICGSLAMEGALSGTLSPGRAAGGLLVLLGLALHQRDRAAPGTLPDSPEESTVLRS